MRALVNPETGTVHELIGNNGEFLVAAPFTWVDVPDDTVPHVDSYGPQGEIIKPAPLVMQFASVTMDGKSSTVYMFKKGAGLDPHSHEEKGHTCNVLRGAVDFSIENKLGHLDVGQEYFFEPGKLHSITATEDGTIIVNITD